MSYMSELYIEEHNKALDRLAKVSKIKFSKEGTPIVMSNTEFFPGVKGYAILDQVKETVFIPLVSSDVHGSFSNLLKDLELWITDGYTVIFTSAFSQVLQTILKAHGYKPVKKIFDSDPEPVLCFQKGGQIGRR